MYNHQFGFTHNPMQSYGQPFNPQGHQQVPQVIYSNRRLQHINCVIPQTQESGGLFIGDTIATLKTQYITENNISAILCLNSEASRNIHLTNLPFDFKYIQTVDHIHYPIKVHFQSAIDYIVNNMKNKKNVLVQCHAGVSRSATIICAYLIKHKALTPAQALMLLKEKRHRAKPNMGFLQQLEEYWSHLNQNKRENKQIKQINFKTPSKKRRQDSITFSPIKTREKQNTQQYEMQEIKINSQSAIPAKTQRSNNNQKQVKTQKKPKILQESLEKKRNHHLRYSEATRPETPYEYFRQQHRTPQPIKKSIYEPENYAYKNPSVYYSPQQPQVQQRLLHQSYVQLPQPQQVYYYNVPQHHYANQQYIQNYNGTYVPLWKGNGY